MTLFPYFLACVVQAYCAYLLLSTCENRGINGLQHNKQHVARLHGLLQDHRDKVLQTLLLPLQVM